ncbi:SDR family oxidoreductase [Geomicrobium halophilum]|uniref:SDR family oxidoreductase n=1 Tax=Geomicrobium halophilum TaxID=549000 RepID=UPI001FE302FA|nr:SDR family oxidoreductase [Geomicrobium halophilum]
MEIIPCDLEDDTQVKAAIPAVVSTFEKIDILVNKGGIQRRSPSVDFRRGIGKNYQCRLTDFLPRWD